MTTHTPPRSTDEDPTVGLRELALFSGLPVDELDQLAAACHVCTAHPGQVIQTQGAPVRLWHLLVRGHAVVQRDGTPIGLVRRGDSWAEHSLLNRQRSPIAVVTLSPVTMLTLRERAFFAIPERHPLLAGRLVARSATSPDRLALPIFNALAHVSRGG